MRSRPLLPSLFSRLPVFILAYLTFAVSVASAQTHSPSSALINEALDKPVDLDLNDVLPNAMKAIEAKTGVPIKADPAVYDLLPWGEQTNITAKIPGQTLRQASARSRRSWG